MRSSMRGQRAQAFLLTTAILVSYNLVAATEVRLVVELCVFVCATVFCRDCYNVTRGQPTPL